METEKKKVELITRTQAWLKAPLREGQADAMILSNGLLSELEALIKEADKAKKEVGPLIGKVKGMQKAIAALEPVNWVPVSRGHLAIGHRPSAKLMTDLKLQGATHLMTLLSEGEGALQTKSLAEKNELGWLWFPMASANPPDNDSIPEIKKLFEDTRGALEAGGSIYIHCSAGIHRTGMISHALLRYLGTSEEGAGKLLKELRVKTSEGVGDTRIAWAEGIQAALGN